MDLGYTVGLLKESFISELGLNIHVIESVRNAVSVHIHM